MAQRGGLERAWNASLRHLLPVVPDYSLVEEEAHSLLPTWIPERSTP
jgi:hypothetical protein